MEAAYVMLSSQLKTWKSWLPPLGGGRKSTLAVVEDAADDRSNPGVFTLHFLRASPSWRLSDASENDLGR